MHEKLIDDCTEYSTSISNMENAPQGCELIAQAASAIRELMSENKRLKGKIVTPSGGTTFIECEDCKTFTRASRHLDSDCETIAELRAKLAAYESCHETAPDLLRDNLRMANELSDMQAKLAACEEERNLIIGFLGAFMVAEDEGCLSIYLKALGKAADNISEEALAALKEGK